MSPCLVPLSRHTAAVRVGSTPASSAQDSVRESIRVEMGMQGREEGPSVSRFLKGPQPQVGVACLTWPWTTGLCNGGHCFQCPSHSVAREAVVSLERILNPEGWEVPSCLFQACQRSRWLKVETRHNIGGHVFLFFRHCKLHLPFKSMGFKT